jgi:hypothetical protein
MNCCHGIIRGERALTTHAAITENKYLGAVLAYVKEQQDRRPPPKIKPSSAKNGYQKTGRKTRGRRSMVDKMIERREAESSTRAASQASDT